MCKKGKDELSWPANAGHPGEAGGDRDRNIGALFVSGGRALAGRPAFAGRDSVGIGLRQAEPGSAAEIIRQGNYGAAIAPIRTALPA